MDRRAFLLGSTALALLAGAGYAAAQHEGHAVEGDFPFKLTDAEWRARLSPESYATLRQAATEYPFTSPLNDEHRPGTFHCAGCDQALFDAATKFESGTGWPSFYTFIEGAVGTATDYLVGYARTEVHCSNCGGHQGHVFEDGPEPTGLRYCINGVALTFRPSAA